MTKTPAQLQREIDESLAHSGHKGGECPRCDAADAKIEAFAKIPTFKIASTDPATLTASQINKELDKLSAQDSQLGQLMIDAGRGYERPSEYLKMSDPLSLALRKNADRRMKLRLEIELRYGPGSPGRLPTVRGFGPRKKKDAP